MSCASPVSTKYCLKPEVFSAEILTKSHRQRTNSKTRSKKRIDSAARKQIGRGLGAAGLGLFLASLLQGEVSGANCDQIAQIRADLDAVIRAREQNDYVRALDAATGVAHGLKDLLGLEDAVAAKIHHDLVPRAVTNMDKNPIA